MKANSKKILDIKYNPRGAAEGLAYGCLEKEPSAEDVKFIADEISLSPPETRIASCATTRT